MTEVDKAINSMAKMILEAAKNVVKDGSFDKTFFGIITDNSGGKYTVTAAGQDYTVKSTQYFALNERVAVTAVQNNYNTLVLHKL